MSLIKSVYEIRKLTYEDNYNKNPYAKDFKKNPYTWFKLKLYMDIGSILVYFLQKTNIKPNTISVIFGLFGILAGILIAAPFKILILLGVILFFLKGILDAVDGSLARIKNQTSLAGDVLDLYGSTVGWVCLWTGFSLYLYNKVYININFISPDITYITSFIFDNFIYVIPIIPTIYAMDIITHLKLRIFNHYFDEIKQKQLDNNSSNNKNKNNKYKIVVIIDKTLSAGARFVDFICLVIFLELFFPIFISWIIFLIFLFWRIIFYIGCLYMMTKKGFAEEYLYTNKF